MKAKSKQLIRSVILISGMVIGLIGVFYAMQYTRTPAFQSSLELFFNPSLQKTWRWCPAETESIEWALSGQALLASEIQVLCEVEMQALEAAISETQEMQPLIVAKAPLATRTLESNASLEVFRIDGLPFKSTGLSNFLKGLKTRPGQN